MESAGLALANLAKGATIEPCYEFFASGDDNLSSMSPIRTTFFWYYFSPRGFGVGGGV
jgi:hypothetical protein